MGKKKVEGGKLLPAKWGYLYFAAVGFLFVLFWKSNADLAREGNLLWTRSYTLSLLGISLLPGGLIGALICFLFYRAADKGLFLIRKEKEERGKLRCGQAFGLCFLLLFLSWLPVFLAYYPAICSYDSPVQVGQALDGYLIEHHPILHTLLIRGALFLGQGVFDSYNTGIAVYTILQMAFLAAAFAYAVTTLYQYAKSRVWPVLLLLYGMWYPFHWYMVVSMTKDTVFTGFFVILITAFYRLLGEKEDSGKPSRQNSRWLGRDDVILFLGIVGMMFFRTNGKYAMLVLLVFLPLILWKGRENRAFWKRISLVVVSAFLAGNLAMSALFHFSGAEQGDKREMLSMPIQQLARCMLYHGGVGEYPSDDGTMGEDDRALINDFLLNECYRYYKPSLADPVKGLTNTYVVRYRTGEFLTTYFRLLGQYPGDFINAGLAVTAGYFYPDDVSHAYINVEESKTGRGYVQTYWFEEGLNPRGLYKDSRWPWLQEKLEAWADRNAYLDMPLFKYFFVPGSWLWLYLVFAGYLLINKRYRMLLPLSLVLGYYMTLFLGPTVQLRYLYPLMTVFPFAVMFCLAERRSDTL